MNLQHWNNYYSENSKPFQESDFATFVLKQLTKNSTIIDIGCGNGRDSVFFAKNKIKTLGIDPSSVAINNLKSYESSYLEFQNTTIEKLNKNKKFDYGYARFLLHSLSSSEEVKFFKKVKLTVRKKIFIENRIYNSETHNQKQLHHRRLESPDTLIKKISSYGFEILHSEISNQFSVYNSNYKVADLNSDPYLIRLIIRSE